MKKGVIKFPVIIICMCVIILATFPSCTSDAIAVDSAASGVSSSETTSNNLVNNTALLVYTDWHSSANTSDSIVREATHLADTYGDDVVVCFNGDSENATDFKTSETFQTPAMSFAHMLISNIKTSEASDVHNTAHEWRHRTSDDFKTPFMLLVQRLLSNSNITVVVGLGNHELAFNAIGAKDGKDLASYLRQLHKIGEGSSNRLHIVNTDLDWADPQMKAVYDEGIVQRSCTVNNIVFMNTIDIKTMNCEVANQKISGVAHAYKKGALYSDALKKDVSANCISRVSEVTEKLSDNASCVLLAHTGYNEIKKLLGNMNLKKHTVLVTGHNHRRHNFSRKPPAGVLQIQPEKYGKGTYAVFADSHGKLKMDKDIFPKSYNPSN